MGAKLPTESVTTVEEPDPASATYYRPGRPRRHAHDVWANFAEVVMWYGPPLTV
jgi:hypothetical protein